MSISINFWWKLNHEKVIPGSMRASIGDEDYKVKEKLKGIWREGKLVKFIVVGFGVEGMHSPALGRNIVLKVTFDVELSSFPYPNATNQTNEP